MGYGNPPTARFKCFEKTHVDDDEILRQDNLDIFSRLVQQIFRQRQKRFVNLRRANLPPLGFEKCERKRSPNEQAIELGQQIFKYRHLLFDARAGNEPDKRCFRLVEDRLEHR